MGLLSSQLMKRLSFSQNTICKSEPKLTHPTFMDSGKDLKLDLEKLKENGLSSTETEDKSLIEDRVNKHTAIIQFISQEKDLNISTSTI